MNQNQYNLCYILNLTLLANIITPFKLFPKNIYSPKSDKYGPQHPHALSDGDEKGRGTSVFLGVRDQETGTKTDVLTRKEIVKTNSYNSGNGYSISDDNVTSGTIGLTPA